MSDEYFMRQALDLAKNGIGFVSPNPCVGALIVKQGRIIGQGYHHKAGAPHAEIEALESCKESAVGATLYVTLEPCTHYGKTPPCVSAIKDAGIQRIVIGARDPNPKVSGNGMRELQETGIGVTIGVEEYLCKQLIRYFAHWASTGTPAVICKVAISADYKIAAKRGMRTEITGPEGRKHAHLLRHECDAIVVGANTVLIDNPHLTDRSEHKKADPLRIILDSTLRSRVKANVFADANVLAATTDKAPEERRIAFQKAGIPFALFPYTASGVSLDALLKYLGMKDITSLLVEGGRETIDAFMRGNYINEWHIFQSPDILGSDGLDVCTDMGSFKSIMNMASAVEYGRDTYYFSAAS